MSALLWILLDSEEIVPFKIINIVPFILRNHDIYSEKKEKPC